MPDDSVRYEISNRIARITLARPPVNALSLAMIEAIVGALREASGDDSVRAVVLASAVPKIFCAGLDLKALHGRPEEEVRALLQALYVQLHEAQHDLGKPSIAAIAGAARGGGMTLAISCDVLLAGTRATFGYPEIDVGVIPAIHYMHLPRIVGRHRAFELLFSGRSFDSEEAYGLGLVSRVVPDAEVELAASQLAQIFAAKSPAIMRLGRAAFMRQNDDRRRIALAAEDFCAVSTTEAAQEGLQEFLDKGTRRGRSSRS